jgi:hypothetical protein
VKRLTGEVVIPFSDNMASIYERVPLYKVAKAWDDNDPNLSEVYKLKSSDPHVVGLLAPSQRYSTSEEEEACQL